MKKYFFVLLLVLAIVLPASSQTARGIRIGYIDMEYILQNVPDYAEAKNQIELKAQKFKQDAETKKNEITRLKEALKTERPLLTKELLEEREEEITFLETELSDFQQKKFGPTGELITQKAVLIKPIQDQVFTIVQDIADAKKYDFIFDKSSDMTMLFAQKRYDISDQVVRALTRTSKRNQLSKKELKEEAKKEYEENLQDESPAQAERQKILDDRKAAREKLVADRKAATEAKRNAALAQRQGNKTAGTAPATDGTATGTDAQTAKAAQQTASAERKAAVRDSIVASREATRQAALEKRNAAAAQRQASKTDTPPVTTKTPETTGNTPPKEGTVTGSDAPKTASTEKNATVKDSIAASKEMARQAALEKRNKTIEERKKALEDKKAKALADREAAKKGKGETNTKPQDSTSTDGTKPKEN